MQNLLLQGMLRAFRTRLGRLAKTAEDLHNLASPDWIPKLATYTNACHYLAYHLRQSHLAVLLLYDPSTPAPSPQTTRASTPAPPSSLPATPAVVSSTLRLPSPSSADFRSYASPADSTATAEAAKASTTGLLGAYESEAVALESFWEKWALKLAKAVAQQFDLDTRSYRYKSHLAEFANTSYSQQEGCAGSQCCHYASALWSSQGTAGLALVRTLHAFTTPSVDELWCISLAGTDTAIDSKATLQNLLAENHTANTKGKLLQQPLPASS